MGDNKSYESFYSGGLSTFEPAYGFRNDVNGTFIGTQDKHRAAFSSNLGFPGSTQTANQLKESVNAIKQGVKAFEVTMGVADTAEQIPKQHFEEMRALMKLSGVTPSVHAPFTIDPSGFEQQKGYSDENREDAERRLFGTLEKARQLSNEKGVTVVFHSSGGVPGTEYRPGDEKKGEERFHAIKTAMVNRETGEMGMLNIEKTFDPMHPEDFKKEGTVKDVKERINEANKENWNKTLADLAHFQRITDDVIGSTPTLLAGFDKITDDVYKNQMSKPQQQAYDRLSEANVYLKNANQKFKGVFDIAYKYGSQEQKKELTDLAEKYKEKINESEGTVLAIENQRVAVDNALRRMQEITYGKESLQQSSSERNSLVPQLLTSAEDFAREKASETFGNLAWRSYNELAKRDAEKAPVIAVENMFTGMAFPKAEDLKQLVEDSRSKFIKNAIKGGVDKKEAEKTAEKLIGVTWDVGHLNLLKKEGFTDEDIRKQSEIIAPYVKHVHLTDNFGHADSHLAPGMGNVPIKKILEELEKTGRLAEMGKIVEAPGFVQHFQKSPHGWTMAALGSPIYGAMMAPYWNQVGGIANGGGYFGGPISYLPEKHFSMYGSGFSSLPTELGGQLPGTQSRFTGAGNA